MNATGTDSQFWDVRNDTFNLSLLEGEDWTPSAPQVKLCVVLLSLVVSLVCNVTVVLTVVRSCCRGGGKEVGDWLVGSRLAIVDVVLTSVSLAAMARDLTGHTAQIIRLVDDEYEIGFVTCRLQAFTNQVFRYLFISYLALLYIERFVRHWRSEEYSLSFPVITMKIILSGIFLVVTSQMTGPLYGWGNYTYLPETWTCGLDLLSSSSCSFTIVVNSFFFLPAWIAMTFTNFTFLRKEPEECMGAKERLLCTSAVLQDEKVKFLLCFTWISVSILSWPRALLETLVACRVVHYPGPDVFFWASVVETETSLLFPLGVLLSSVFSRHDPKKLWRQRPK